MGNSREIFLLELYEDWRLNICLDRCRRLRQLAERSEYFRSELRSIHHQTWFLPNDQAFASMGSSLSYLLDQSSINNTNEINEVRPSYFHSCIPHSTYTSAWSSSSEPMSYHWYSIQVRWTQPNKWWHQARINGWPFEKWPNPMNRFKVELLIVDFLSRFWMV